MSEETQRFIHDQVEEWVQARVEHMRRLLFGDDPPSPYSAAATLAPAMPARPVACAFAGTWFRRHDGALCFVSEALLAVLVKRGEASPLEAAFS